MQMRTVLTLSGAILLPLVAAGLTACDDFPENAAITLLDGAPTVVFKSCAPSERIEEIAVLRWDGSGNDDSDYTTVWTAVIPGERSEGYIWPLSSTHDAYADVPADTGWYMSDATYRVYVWTSETRILTAFHSDELVEGRVRHHGEQIEVADFLQNDSVC